MPKIEDLLALLETDPKDAFLRYGVAMEYARQGKHDDALREFGVLLAQSPEYVAGYFMAGRSSELKGDMEQAKQFYREGISVAKRIGDAHAASEISTALMMIE